MLRALCVYGTRPEAIKMAPLVREMRLAADFCPIVATTGQHSEMVNQVHSVFSIAPDHDFQLLRSGQPLGALSEAIMHRTSELIEQTNPDVILVQGDTTSAAMAGLASFYHKVPVVHVEAGLRTGDPLNPFPEEMNRQLLGRLSSLHLAPTSIARRNLEREGVSASSIVVTGNTVIDALLAVLSMKLLAQDVTLRGILSGASPRGLVTVTTHRRESWGAPMESVFRAVDRLSGMFPHTDFVLPLHPNPLVRRAADRTLTDRSNIFRVEPLGYTDFCSLMNRSQLLLSDSGGVQEEAPALGVPVLVLRETTERPEAVASGWATLVGTDEEGIVLSASRLLCEGGNGISGLRRSFVYGDGTAAARSLDAIRSMFGRGQLPPDFEPGISIQIPDMASVG